MQQLSKSNVSIVVGIVIAVLLVVAVALWQRQPAGPGATTPPGATPPGTSSQPTAPPAPVIPSTNQMPSAPHEEGQDVVIINTDAGFAPQTLEVAAGTVVTFNNLSSFHMWPASAVHPTHTAYPTKGGCLGSTFDACNGIQPGASWSFQFDLTGTWKYHDHLSPSHTGAVIVR